ncbi:MAG: hypothetical protein HC827_12035 [Cyanobacteria bacterium RM1_2_2]|nr:hypothetical protein [Cyanobacteria bacterium RM1_2_2]
MARRYSQIRRGAEYDAALDNYVAYIRDAATRPTKRMQGGARGARRETLQAALLPFGIDLPANTFAAARISQTSFAAIGATLTNRTYTGATQLAAATPLAKFRPARVSAFRGTGAATYVQSKVTKLYYLKYEGDSFTAPIGALNAAEEEADGCRLVRTAIQGVFGAADIQRISFSPEKVPV